MINIQHRDEPELEAITKILRDPDMPESFKDFVRERLSVDIIQIHWEWRKYQQAEVEDDLADVQQRFDGILTS